MVDHSQEGFTVYISLFEILHVEECDRMITFTNSFLHKFIITIKLNNGHVIFIS